MARPFVFVVMLAPLLFGCRSSPQPAAPPPVVRGEPVPYGTPQSGYPPVAQPPPAGYPDPAQPAYPPVEASEAPLPPGQIQSARVHERNAQRKAAKRHAKAKRKAHKRNKRKDKHE